LLKQPRVYFAFVAAKAQCWLVLILLPSRAPRAFLAELPPSLQTQPVQLLGIILSQIQDITFIFATPHTVLVGNNIPAAEVSLNGGYSFKSICLSSRFGCHAPTQ